MSLALSLCQYVLRSKRGLAQASPGLAQASPSLKAPRLQAFEARDLLHQHNRKGQVVMIKTRRYKRLVFGFVFCTWNWYDFWKRSGGLPCSRPLLPTQCWFVWCWCVSTLEQGSGRRCRGGLKNRTFKEAPDSTCWGSIFGPPCRGNVFKKGSESGPAWNQKWSPLEGPVLVPFWHLHCGKSVEAFISSRSWFDQHQLRLESWTGEAHFCAPAFSWVLRSKKGSLLCHIVLLQFPWPWGPRGLARSLPWSLPWRVLF